MSCMLSLDHGWAVLEFQADLGNPWWKDVVNGMVIGTTVITAALIGLYVFSEIISRKTCCWS